MGVFLNLLILLNGHSDNSMRLEWSELSDNTLMRALKIEHFFSWMGNRPQWQFHNFREWGGITFCHGFSSHSKRVPTWTKCFPYLANTSTTLYQKICWSDRKDKTCVYIVSKNYEITYTSCSITKHTEWFGHHLMYGRLKRHATCLIAAIQRRTNMSKLRGEARGSMGQRL